MTRTAAALFATGILATGALAVKTANPFTATKSWYVNPSFQAELDTSIATASGTALTNLQAIRDVPSAYWIDVKDKVTGNATDSMEGILADAYAKGGELVTFIVYDVPNRDCHAVASNGEICCTYNADGTCDYEAGGDCADGIAEYYNDYVDPMYEVLDAYDDKVEIVLIIEPDSLPNLATNLDDSKCGNTATQTAYTTAIAYTITKFSTLDVTMYLDAGHGGWLGWVDNMADFRNVLLGMDFDLSMLRGFATNTANYQPLGTLCPEDRDSSGRNNYCLPSGTGSGDACCSDPCKLTNDWNEAVGEYNYAALLQYFFTSSSWAPKFVIDTGRNGVEDMRSDCANWCNIDGAGIGLLPTTESLYPTMVDALFWLKTPGESDGCTSTTPEGTACARYDTFCGSSDSITMSTEGVNAPEAGQWFDFQIKMLAANANFIPYDDDASPVADDTPAATDDDSSTDDSSCPGGDLASCIDLCPSDASAFQACVTTCEERC